MKQSLQFLSAGLCMLMSSLFLPAYAQDYPKVVDPGKMLIYAYNSYPDGGVKKTIIKFGTEEVTIEGVRYTPVYSVNETTSDADRKERIIAYMREENGKVYYYDPPYIRYANHRISAHENEAVLYDFTIPVGGSYIIDQSAMMTLLDPDEPWKEYYSHDELKVTLNSIETIVVDGQERRKYTYTLPDYVSEDDDSYTWNFIEGIGPERGTINDPVFGNENSGRYWVCGERLLAVYDYEKGNVVYDCHGLPAEEAGGWRLFACTGRWTGL